MDKKSENKSWLRKLGPGFITGAADSDPTAIGTYTQSGAQFYYGQLWTALYLLPLMYVVQEMVGRIALASGQGLSAIIRKQYSKILALAVSVALLAVNVITLGADLGAMADAAEGILPQVPSTAFLLMFAGLILALQIFFSYRTVANVLKWLAFSLLTYFITMLLVTHDWSALAISIIKPTIIFDRNFLFLLISILGTAVSPYMFFWQSSEEIEEQVAEGNHGAHIKKGTNQRELRSMRNDTLTGMAFTQFISLCIGAASAGALYANGVHEVSTGAQAAAALKPLTGGLASYLYTIGIIGTGLLAVPVLGASAAYALADVFKLPQGLHKKLHQAYGFYAIIVLATILGLGIDFINMNAVDALVLAAAINGLAVPFILTIIILIANDHRIMKGHVNSWWSNIIGVITVLATAAAGVLLFLLK